MQQYHEYLQAARALPGGTQVVAPVCQSSTALGLHSAGECCSQGADAAARGPAAQVLPENDYRFVRRTMVSLVLGTDMALHSDITKARLLALAASIQPPARELFVPVSVCSHGPGCAVAAHQRLYRGAAAPRSAGGSGRAANPTLSGPKSNSTGYRRRTLRRARGYLARTWARGRRSAARRCCRCWCTAQTLATRRVRCGSGEGPAARAPCSRWLLMGRTAIK